MAAHEGIVPEAQAWEKIVEPPLLMGAIGNSVSPRAGAGWANEAMPQPIGAPGWAVLTPRSSRDPDPNPSREAAVGDLPSTLGSSDIMALGNEELGLPEFPRMPLLPAGWGQVVGGVELACSQVATMRILLWETLTMVGQDVLQPARVSLKMV
jgi:hypothetical protein